MMNIVLDPTELYDIPPDYIPITTEVEWIQFFGVTNSRYWVRGKRLCDWAEAWLRAWNKTDAIMEIKLHPRRRFTALFDTVPVPEEWTDAQLLILLAKLDSYPQNPVAHLLAEITGEEQIWFAQPAISHLAAWLAMQVPQEYRLLELVWQRQFQKHELATYYQTDDKLSLLRRWLGIATPVIPDLGKYPLPIPDFLYEEFDAYWEELLYNTEGKILENIIPTQVAGMERIAKIAHKVLQNRPHWINKVRETKVTPYLKHQQQLELGNQSPPQSLPIDASPTEALEWVTQNYLPFRRWEIIVKQPSLDQRISDHLADSFVNWMLQHYPQMTLDSVENSYLNYSVAAKVQNLCRESPVLWVVVDGLGWLDHLELLSYLTQNHQLALETQLQPRFSILPTKTEYAKWSLYAQLLPSDVTWAADAGKAFAKMGIGRRYTDRKIDQLYNALQKKTHKLYCWDTDIFDNLYHSQIDWQSLYTLDRPHTLEGIAKKINYCLQQYPKPEELRIVIASDHGQVMGTQDKISHCPPELEPKGRMAIGKTDDPRFVVLECDRYNLPHDISIVRNAASLGAFSYTNTKQIIGCHGGLFPEEVVVGVSVLRKSIQRAKVYISCRGEGKSRQPGELEITIDNPNSVPLTNLCLYIPELPAFNSGKSLEQQIPANQRIHLRITIPEVPELPPSHERNYLSLCGELTFRFANLEPGSTALASDSQLKINQLFSSGFNIDEFL
ncbi:hypothetical protein [Fischerella sp. JS2]|uniref:hypothetical protein n=1 Tax=Fischerella sp. JS2 TaxID=2597771 RepID=UPI0028E93B99|nr:hypothetical protein [Fischerella sp. JS2]